MIVLYGRGPAFGLPDACPFAMKVEVQLRMAGLAYSKRRAAPGDELPFIEDKGMRIADATFIRAHVEAAYRLDLDRGLTPDMRARGWAAERMIEDHLHFALLHAHWLDDANWAKGPSHIFGSAADAQRERLRRDLEGHGIGRHPPQRVAELGCRSLTALAGLLGNKPYLFGPAPTAADATAFAFVAAATAPVFESRLKDSALGHRNLIAHRDPHDGRALSRLRREARGVRLTACPRNRGARCRRRNRRPRSRPWR